MPEIDDNPYAAPEANARPPAPTPPRLSLANRVFSTAFITFATFLLLANAVGLLLDYFAPEGRRSKQGIAFSDFLATAVVISGFYAFGFWLRRDRQPSSK
jgi:hypothetical protein